MKSNSVLVIASIAAALTACGGGSANSRGGTVATASYLAFSSPNTIPASTGTSSANGSVTTLAIGGKTASMGTYDKDGNATVVDGDFGKVVAFGANSAVQLCSQTGDVSDGTSGFKSAYSLALANAQPVSLNELLGLSFKVYEDCVFSYDATLNRDGSLTTDGETETPASVAAAFSPEGYTFTEAGVSANIKASAYRFTVNGATFYAVIDRGNVVPYMGTLAYNALWISNAAVQ